ncbi:MAG: hypothetical protein LBT98_00980 [Puniceicoccales bacterium]|jgi:hypothetical protein|nr:hypothetical protein [Puniceicoccales bacterium]
MAEQAEDGPSPWRRLWHWSIRRRWLLLAALIVCLLPALILPIRSSCRARSLRRLQEQFLAAWPGGLAARLAFVNSQGNRPLGALMAYAIACEREARGDWEDAAALYAGGECWRGTGLDGIAALARAVALIRSGEGSRARSLLATLAADRRRSRTVRGGAWYLQALAAYGEGEWELARAALDELSRLAPTGIWEQKAALLALAVGRES